MCIQLIQSEHIYNLCMEYQMVPNFMLHNTIIYSFHISFYL